MITSTEKTTGYRKMAKLDIKSIKLRKDRVDEFRVNHWFDAGTEYLPKCYAHKHYSYTVYDAEGKMLSFDEYLPTLKAVKEWIANYDDVQRARIAEEKRQEEEYAAQRAAEKAAEKAIIDSFTAETTNATYSEGEEIQVREGKLSKPSNVGEAFSDMYSTKRAKVAKVTEITAEEFDAACANLYSNFKSEWLLDGNVVENTGGHYSDDSRLEGKSYDEVFSNPELTGIFHATSYVYVHAIVAPGRQTLFVNTEGYNYPRYVAKAA